MVYFCWNIDKTKVDFDMSAQKIEIERSKKNTSDSELNNILSKHVQNSSQLR